MTSVPHSGAKSVTHTPGPWRTNGCYISSNYGEVGHAYFVSSMPEDMSEANARLIAAAPELLDALRRLLATTDSKLSDTHDDGCGCVFHEARSAISKATAGETRNAEGAL